MLGIAKNFKLQRLYRVGTQHLSAATSTESTAVKDYEAEKAKLVAQLQKDLPTPYNGPERDLVNFPRRLRLENPGVIRHGFVPQEWLDFFYKKTGVTGPYIFGFGLLNFLLSKELYVIEEELSTGVALFILIYIGFKKLGPSIKNFALENMKKESEKDDLMRFGTIAQLEEAIENEKKSVVYMEAGSILCVAKKENVHMQLETEYRARMMTAYTQVKKRLDYFFEMDATKRKLEQKHMVDWIVQNVVKSITPQQEKEALQKCISDLKILAARAP